MTVIHRLNTRRLPRAKDLKKRVDRGESLSEYDLLYMERIFADAGKIKPYIDRNAEYRDIYIRLVSLYLNIVHTALENEEKG